VELGNKLIPVLNDLMGKFKEFWGFLKNNSTVIYNSIVKPFLDLKDSIMPVLQQIGDAFSNIFSGGSGGVFSSAMSLIRELLIGIKAILEPIFKLIGDVTSAFSDMFKDVRKNSEYTFRQKTIADLSYFATAATEIIGGVIDVMQVGFSKDILNPSKMAAATNRILNAKSTAQAAEQNTLAELKKSAKEQKWDEMFARGKSVNDERLKSALAGLDSVLNTDANGSKGTLDANGKPTKMATSTVDEIKSGRPMNIYIDINKLVESFNVTATNIDDMNNKVKDMVAQALMSAVNNVNLIAK
jgi:uncharacterized protein YoxC